MEPLGYEARVRRIRSKYDFMDCGLKSEDVNPLFINMPSLPKNYLFYLCLTKPKLCQDDRIKCSLCFMWVHRKCIDGMRKNYMTICISMFPFCSIDNTELDYIFTDLVDLNGFSNLEEIYTKCSVLNNIDFQQPSTNNTEFDIDINPDNHFYNNLNNTCAYSTPEQTNSNSGLTIFQINSRSLNKFFDKIEHLIQTMVRKPDVISIAETWFKDSTPISLFNLNWYILYSNYRKNGKLCCGGVAIYVDANLLSKFEPKFTTETEYFQSISVNIEISHNKCINIISIYRTPDTCMDTFTDSIDNLLKNNKEKTYLRGDFNIDLIKAHNHHKTEHFINTIFGMGFHPLITKPTRITSYSATLIDNIFKNDS